MSEEVKAPKYPICDHIKVPEHEIENWQATVDLLAEIAHIPAALVMRVHASEIEVFVSSQSPGNVYHPGERATLNTGLYCETVMSTQRDIFLLIFGLLSAGNVISSYFPCSNFVQIFQRRRC
jgi:hypothetical protein